MSIGERLEGSVKTYKEPWGWITCAAAGADVFCHIQDVERGHLSKDAAVSFELGTDQKSGKPRALHIEVEGLAESQEGASSGPRLTGSIKSWREAWGWIASPDLAENIFGHKEDLVNADPHHELQVGTEVRFDVGTDSKSGKPRAKRIELLDVPEPSERLTGEITSWKEQWGWIRCDEAEGGDVFAHSDDLMTVVQVGIKVTFEMGTDKTGRRRGRKISALGGKGKGGKGKGGMDMQMMPMHHGDRRGGYGKGPEPMMQGRHMKGDMGMKGGFGGCYGGGYGPPGYGPHDGYGGCGGGGFMGGHPGDFGPAFHGGPPPGFGGKGGMPGPQAFIGQQLEGRVAMWKELWGWISCPLFGGDIFAHKEDLKGGGDAPAKDTRVFFIPGTDNKGRMRALQISTGGKGGSGGGSGSKRKAESKPRAGEADFEQLEGSVIEGEVASWRSPWGWIKSPNFAGDLFAHKEDVLSGEELTPGQQVSFLVARDHKSSRWRAREINNGAMDGVHEAKKQRF